MEWPDAVDPSGEIESKAKLLERLQGRSTSQTCCLLPGSVGVKVQLMSDGEKTRSETSTFQVELQTPTNLALGQDETVTAKPELPSATLALQCRFVHIWLSKPISAWSVSATTTEARPPSFRFRGRSPTTTLAFLRPAHLQATTVKPATVWSSFKRCGADQYLHVAMSALGPFVT